MKIRWFLKYWTISQESNGSSIHFIWTEKMQTLDLSLCLSARLCVHNEFFTSCWGPLMISLAPEDGKLNQSQDNFSKAITKMMKMTTFSEWIEINYSTRLQVLHECFLLCLFLLAVTIEIRRHAIWINIVSRTPIHTIGTEVRWSLISMSKDFTQMIHIRHLQWHKTQPQHWT